MIEIEILRFFRCFSRIYKNRERYKADKIGERADSWPTSIFMLKMDKEKLFHR